MPNFVSSKSDLNFPPYFMSSVKYYKFRLDSGDVLFLLFNKKKIILQGRSEALHFSTNDWPRNANYFTHWKNNMRIYDSMEAVKFIQFAKMRFYIHN